MSIFPPFVAFRHLNNHLEYLPDSVRVRNTSPMVLSEQRFTRFELVPIRSTDRVHIRCSFNRKFLRRAEGATQWLVPTADEANEDSSQASCTMFRAVFSNNRIQLYFFSPQGQLRVGLNNSTLGFGTQVSSLITFDVIDLNTLVLFPKFICFKGDNNRYLAAFNDTVRGKRLKFDSNQQTNPAVQTETFTLNNGNVRFRSLTQGGFWRKMNGDWIKCDSNDTTANDPNTVFRPVRRSLTQKSVGLVNLANNKFCMRWPWGGQPKLVDTLRSAADTLEPLATMTVEEAILDRIITNVDYNFKEVRIYNSTIQETVPQVVVNSTPNTANHWIQFRFRELKRETFSSSHSWKIAYKSTLTVSVIPKLVEGKVEIEANYEGNVTWEEVHETDREVISGFNVPVPPWTISTVTGIVSRGMIDVPYTYDQIDILLNGQQRTTRMRDGIFTGLNTWLFNYKSQEAPIPRTGAAHQDTVAAEDNDEEEEEEEEYDNGKPVLPSRL